MNLKHLLACTGLTASSLLAIAAAPAHALSASFSPFSFSTDWTGAPPKGDIVLNSVTAGSDVYDDFLLVNSADIVYNDTWTGGNTGAASSDLGDNATVGTKLEVATDESIASSLGNLNLNSIVDTEDKGNFTIDISFSKAVNRLFFWERGMNSKLKVQALGASDTVLAEYLLDSANGFNYAGFDIDTTEIGGKQKVGALGLFLDGTSAKKFRLISETSYNGPDFKVTAAAPVPEPATMAGTALAASAMFASWRKKRESKTA